jgi:hypothetical protein
VTCAYFPQTILPDCVTKPSSLTLTSMIVPFVNTPRFVYNADDGFFFTPMISKQKVVLSSGCVTCAFLTRKPVGRMYLSSSIVRQRLELAIRGLPFIFRCFTSKSFAYKGGLGNHPLPILLFPLATANLTEHLIIADRSNLFAAKRSLLMQQSNQLKSTYLGYRNTPLASLFFSFLFDGVGEDLGADGMITIQ